MRYRAELFAGAILLGAALRLLALPLPGTTDVPIFKVWTYHAAVDGVAGLYGTGGVFPERRVLEYQGVRTKVDYPPLALDVLDAAGSLYRRAHGGAFPDTPALTASIKATGLVAEAGLALLLFLAVRRSTGVAAAQWAAVAVWLNPASILIGSVLGYLDPLFVLPAVGALAAGAAERPALAGALITAACLIKPLAIFIAPAVTLAVWQGDRAARPARLLKALAGAAVLAGVVLAPLALSGGFWNMTWSVGSLLRDPFLSANGASVWRFAPRAPLGPRLDLLRGVGALATGAAIVWACARAPRQADLSILSALAAFSIHAYATLAVSVHENHLFAAVPLLALAAAFRPRLTGVFVAISAIVALDLNLSYGFGQDVGYAIPRSLAGLDAGIMLALANAAAFVWHGATFARESTRRCGDAAPRGLALQ